MGRCSRRKYSGPERFDRDDNASMGAYTAPTFRRAFLGLSVSQQFRVVVGFGWYLVRTSAETRMSSKPVPLIDPIQQLFTSHHLRCTRQRRALYDALSASAAHPTADHLYRQLARSDQTISLATVYNTLEAFCKAGLAKKLSARGGSSRYDATVHNHLHVRDEKSGMVADVPDDLGQKLLSNIPPHIIIELETQLGFRVSQLQIELVGEYL